MDYSAGSRSGRRSWELLTGPEAAAAPAASASPGTRTSEASSAALRRRRRRVRVFYRHPGLKLAGLLLPPAAWMLVVYLGALLLLFVASFWRLDPFTGSIVQDWGLENFQMILTEPVYRIITLRTVGDRGRVTITDIVLAFPIAYYAARMAPARRRDADRCSRSSCRCGRATWSGCSPGG